MILQVIKEKVQELGKVRDKQPCEGGECGGETSESLRCLATANKMAKGLSGIKAVW